MKRRIALITGTENTRVNLLEQLNSYIGDIVEIESYATDEGIDNIISAELIVISSPLIYDDAIKHIDKECPIILTRRVLNYSEIEKILLIPPKERVLFVNDVKETTMECIDWLKKIGINHIEYIPFYPGCQYMPAVDIPTIAITPGEIDLVPSYIKRIIDMGTRMIDITTIAEILKELGMFDEKWEHITQKHMNKVIDLAKNLASITHEKTEAYQHIKIVMDGVRDGILAFDREGSITVFNENLKYMLGVKRSNIIGKNIREIIGDRHVLEFLADGRDDTSKIFNIKGQELLSTRFRIEKEDTTVVTFKDTNRDNQEVERQTRRELYNRGYYAKYSFNDITGRSLQIQQIKAIARKLAVSDLTVLIEGESGTGKELFASAIHNESPRRNKPFVAINFSSISENLVESELFGYEEGAFTGAIKGGKQGLFEQADGGTIFLDEIGDISLKVQSRLLRVLQEKEIMRVGGTKIMPIDVRVIAATNQNLSELVNKGSFRTDLYHRLKVLYIKLPPLRERREDIKALIRQFIEQKAKDNLTIDDEVITKLQQYPWYGNVRELKNTIDYMLAVCDKKHIYLEDMPQESFFQPGKMEEDHERSAGIELRGDYECILKALYEEMQREGKASRQKISELSKAYGFNLSEQMVRYRLNELESLGYVTKSRGKSGTMLTPYGIERVQDIIRR